MIILACPDILLYTQTAAGTGGFSAPPVAGVVNEVFPLDYALFISSLLFFEVSMCFTPGPNNAIAMSIGLDKGFRAALPFSFGGSIGCTAQLLVLALGLTEIFTRYPAAYEVLRYLGAAYMVWLAWCISGLRLPFSKARAQTQPTAETAAPAATDAAQSGLAAERKPFGFFAAFFFQVLNVKVWLTNIVVVSSFVGAGADRWQRLWIAAGVGNSLSLLAMFAWAAGGVFMGRFLTSEGVRRANYIFAVFLLISVGLLFI